MADKTLSLAEFGASIKAKYPAYKDVPDDEIGTRMLDKYPVYRERVATFTTSAEEPPESFGRQAGRAVLNSLPGIGGLVGGALSTPETLGTGTIAGVALGAAAGKGLRDLLAEGFGLEKPTTPEVKAVNIALEGGTTAALSALLPGIVEAAKNPRATLGELVELIPKRWRPVVPDVMKKAPAQMILQRPAWQNVQKAAAEAAESPAARTTGTSWTPAPMPTPRAPVDVETAHRPAPSKVYTPPPPQEPPMAGVPAEAEAMNAPKAPAPVPQEPPMAPPKPVDSPGKSPSQTLNEIAIAARRAKVKLTLADYEALTPAVQSGEMSAAEALSKHLESTAAPKSAIEQLSESSSFSALPTDAERTFPPNKSGLPTKPPTARKARGKIADLADMKAVFPAAALGAAAASGEDKPATASSDPWTKAQTIGAPKVGEHYALPSMNEIMSSDNPIGRLLEYVTGPARPRSVASQDPFGLIAMEQGGQVPAMLGTTEDVGGKALGTLAKTLKKTGTKGEYVLKPEVVERLKSFLQIGQKTKGSNWAGAESKELIAAFGGDKAKALQWARMWGATSPNTSVPVNTREAVSALAHMLENPGATLTAEQARLLPDVKITMAGSKVPNLNRAMAGQPLSGDKVEAMSAFMAGEPRIPIDVHALYGLGTKGDKLSPELSALRAYMTKTEGLPARGGLTDTDLYLRYEKALKSALESIAPEKSVNETFATLWEGARAHKGLKPQGGPIDILRKKGLLEFGAMLEPERLRSALRSAGWTASAIAGLMAAMPSNQYADLSEK